MKRVATCAAGSEIVFSYVPVDQELNEVGREIIGVFSRMAAKAGEPFTMRFTATEIESLVERCSLHVAEDQHPTTWRHATSPRAATACERTPQSGW